MLILQTMVRTRSLKNRSHRNRRQSKTNRQSGGGKIDVSELKVLLEQVEGRVFLDADTGRATRRLSNKIKTDGKGDIDLSEFVVWFSNKKNKNFAKVITELVHEQRLDVDTCKGDVMVCRDTTDDDKDEGSPQGQQRSTALLVALMERAPIEVITALLEKRANASAENKYGVTALRFALRYGGAHAEKVVRALLDKEADASAKDKDGWTALHDAAIKGAPAEVITALLEARANVSATTTADIETYREGSTRKGSTALHIAAGKGAHKVIGALLQWKADARVALSATDEDGNTPADLAKQNGHTALAQTLREVQQAGRHSRQSRSNKNRRQSKSNQKKRSKKGRQSRRSQSRR